MEHVTVIDQLRHLPSATMTKVDRALRDGATLADAYRAAGLCRTCGQVPGRCPATFRVERKSPRTQARRGLKVGVLMAGWIVIAAVLAVVLSGCTGQVVSLPPGVTPPADAGVSDLEQCAHNSEAGCTPDDFVDAARGCVHVTWCPLPTPPAQ